MASNASSGKGHLQAGDFTLTKVCRFDLNFPVRFCLKTPAQPVPPIQPVIPATAGIVSTHRAAVGDSRFCRKAGRDGSAGVNENENKKFAVKKREFSNQTGIKSKPSTEKKERRDLHVGDFTLTEVKSKPSTGERERENLQAGGFTLIEVVAAVALLAGLLAVTSLIWTGAFKRLTKAGEMERAVLLLQRKMNDLETLYKNDNIRELPEKGEGEFPQFGNFKWRYETRPLILPNADILLKLQELPQNDTNLNAVTIIKNILSESAVELKLTVTHQKGKEYSLTSYFINYNEVPLKVLSALSQILPAGGGL